ncbi:MAG TPA: acylphosphatase [Bacteroidales bacterium]|nr:acylphosphatase [Bacteroidales bacterium]
MEDRLLYRIRVTGRVQGVGFRWNAANEARNIGIKGIVKNLYDGSVYIEAEGTSNQLKSYLEWCRKGPSFSRVDKVDVETGPAPGYNDFRIEH